MIKGMHLKEKLTNKLFWGFVLTSFLLVNGKDILEITSWSQLYDLFISTIENPGLLVTWVMALINFDTKGLKD